jgi:glycosyltransferase involved in cell wall biosynthesis
MPLRVLFLVGRDPVHPGAGGGDIQAFAWAKWLTAQGHEVTYVCQSHPTLPRSEVVSGIKIERLGAGPALAWRAFRYYWRHRAEVDLVYEDPIGGGRTPFLSPLYARRPIVAVWHQVSADLFHSLHPYPTAVFLSLVERAIAVAYRGCWLWAPSDESARAIVEQLRIPGERIAVVSPTIEPVAVTASGAGVTDPNILLIGVIRRYKSADHVIRAVSLVKRTLPDVRLTVAGRRMDEDYEEELLRLVEQLGLEDNVSFETAVTEEQKWNLLSRSRVLVLPSQLEGFGIVSIEAHCAGVPVVASSGVPWVAVEHGISGLRYDYGDVTRLADCLVAVLTDDQVYGDLSVGALRAAQSRTPAAVGMTLRDYGGVVRRRKWIVIVSVLLAVLVAVGSRAADADLRIVVGGARAAAWAGRPVQQSGRVLGSRSLHPDRDPGDRGRGGPARVQENLGLDEPPSSVSASQVGETDVISIRCATPTPPTPDAGERLRRGLHRDPARAVGRTNCSAQSTRCRSPSTTCQAELDALPEDDPRAAVARQRSSPTSARRSISSASMRRCAPVAPPSSRRRSSRSRRSSPRRRTARSPQWSAC